MCKNTFFCNILKIFSGRYYRLLKMFVSMVLLWDKDSDRNNLTRCCRKGLLVKLR